MDLDNRGRLPFGIAAFSTFIIDVVGIELRILIDEKSASSRTAIGQRKTGSANQHAIVKERLPN